VWQGGRIGFIEPDEVWAYRARCGDAVTPVRVLRLGTKKPARLLVRSEHPAQEGHEQWVPPDRPKVWENSDAINPQLLSNPCGLTTGLIG
jgi:hypothetical protein